ncbi:Muramoyltetrapeptide carboxypeptidase LdcA (peptidoglycan recycling) [Granulicatella balaenopterae]|uniref:Muramoyltetrapeptide carboxypeptidase LdcA (Peptidoglycan recycling) n=1 Tax=Granulicatella balaenopterae TaxID=137733 RepID=A0A1H9K6M1_9LACT|nr:LD-carboxypeptidase [Granulicatella balaenopterae]SEQ94780.1 Muramoyltetrapeptide carboxypeptidase LdcA (peptidoglycan recycling) [Granulicatella balaenopterae]
MKKAVLVGMSNGKPLNQKRRVNQVVRELKAIDIFSEVIVDASVYINVRTGVTLEAEERANVLMDYLVDPSVGAIFDVSGGDMANTIVPYLDIKKIQKSKVHFFGYSDVSVLLNILTTKTDCTVWNFPVMTLAGPYHELQTERLRDVLQGNYQGPVILGGNIRCTLKLAGTPYWPDLVNQTLLIEAFSGSYEKVMSMLCQYEMIGAFKEASMVLVGRFTELEKANRKELIMEHLQRLANEYHFTVQETYQIGHIPNSIPVKYAKPHSSVR